MECTSICTSICTSLVAWLAPNGITGTETFIIERNLSSRHNHISTDAHLRIARSLLEHTIYSQTSRFSWIFIFRRLIYYIVTQHNARSQRVSLIFHIILFNYINSTQKSNGFSLWLFRQTEAHNHHTKWASSDGNALSDTTLTIRAKL